MRIKLNVLANGTCAHIYAYAEEHDASWREDTYPIRAVKIWHNDSSESLQIKFNPLKNYDNDYVVTFKSKVPFNQFCDDFSSSEYNQAENYRKLTHNCANAANYALKIAAIDLPINWVRLTTLLASPAWRIPSTILTPYDLFIIGKDYKINNLQSTPRPLSHINFKMDLASSKLLFWAKSAENAHQKPYVEKIVSAVKETRLTRPHHDECYLEALIKTNDLLTHENTRNEDTEYKQLIQFFKERVPPKSDLVADQFENRIALSFLLILIASLTDYQLESSNLTLPVTLLSIASCCYFAACDDTDDNESSTVVATPLSDAMTNLVRILE